jgi:hypothetical protein
MRSSAAVPRRCSLLEPIAGDFPAFTKQPHRAKGLIEQPYRDFGRDMEADDANGAEKIIQPEGFMSIVHFFYSRRSWRKTRDETLLVTSHLVSPFCRDSSSEHRTGNFTI